MQKKTYVNNQITIKTIKCSFMYSQLQPSNDKKELKYTKFSVFNIQFNDRVEDEGGGVEVKRVREGMMRIILTLKVCFQETLHAKV